MKKALLTTLFFMGLITLKAQTTLSVQINSSSDDAEEEAGSGAMYTNSSDLELVFDDFVNDNQYIGLRFNGLSIPQGAIIANAFIQFTVDELKANDPSVLEIWVEDDVNPMTYSTSNGDISNRMYVEDSVIWHPGSWNNVGDQGYAQRTPSIARLVQAIVSKGSWTSGNSMAFGIAGTGTRTAEAYDGSSSDAPILVVQYYTTAPTANYTLQVLHASDLEGGVEAIEDAPNFAAILDTLEGDYDNTVIISSGDNWIPGPFFNAASEAPIEDSLRDILSDFYGSPLNDLTTARGRIDVSLMNVMGFDASTFGNHEFDAGTFAIQDIIAGEENGGSLEWMGAQFPYLSSNLDFSASNLSGFSTTSINPSTSFITDVNNPASAPGTQKIAPATTIMRNGEMIGVVGATTQLLETISSPGDVTVVGNPTGNDMVQLAGIIQPYIDSLTAQGVDKIIITTHLQQFALEQELAGLLSDVDIIIAGGSDFLLADSNDILRPGDVAEGPYPYIAINADTNPVMIVSTDGQYSYVGRLVVGFDANGILLPTTLDDQVNGAFATINQVRDNLWGMDDPFTTGTKGYYAQRLTNSIKDIVVAKDGNTFGKTEVFLEGRRNFVRTEETNMGDLTADANLWMAKKYDPTVLVSLKNGGGIRAEIGVIEYQSGDLLPPQPNPVAGKDSLEVSQLDIENTLRFNNNLTVVETTPGGLWRLLEHGINDWDGIATQGKMPQIGGVRFSFDPTQPAYSRIVNMAITDENDMVIDSVVVNGALHGDTTRTIKMVSLNFLVNNDGDGYPFSIETSNAVDLDSNNINHTQMALFSDLGSEQNALAEYLLNFHDSIPFDMEETDATEDTRIQILSLRNDEVFTGPDTSGMFTLQLLHASDLEGGVDAIEDAPNFAALIDLFEDEYDHTLVISSGDNWIPGPFFNAASEAPIEDSLRDILSDFYGQPLNDLTTARGRIDISLMNVMGFDASVFGNHEFDATTSAIEDIIVASGGANITWMGAQFPYISANLDFSASNLAPYASTGITPQSDFITDLNDPANAGSTKKIAPATTIMRDGEMIGVIGATTQLLETISSPGDVAVVGNPITNDMNQLAGILQPYIDSLVAMGSNKIILTTHLQQFSLEQQLAGLLNHVDIIIAGGSDFLLADGNDILRPGDVAAGPYPFATSNADGDPLLIVSTDGQYSYVGRLVVDFDSLGVLDLSSLDSTVNGAYATLPNLVDSLWGSDDPFANGTKGYFAERLTNSIKDIVIAKDGNTFGKTNFFLEGRRSFVRTEETNIGNLTADANLWMAKNYDPEVMVSLKNGGGIRAEIGIIDYQSGALLPPQPNPVAGKDSLEVSQLDIENTLRFNNGLTVVETTPGGLLELLNHGISDWDGIATQGKMPQVGGVRFSFDPTQPAGSRIVNVAIIDENDVLIDTVVFNGVPYGDTSRVIKMVSLNFLVDNNGDGYPFSTTTSNPVALDANNLQYTQTALFADLGSEQNALAEYLSTLHSSDPYDKVDTDPSEDMRIQILSLRADSVLNPEDTTGFFNPAYAEGSVEAFPNPAAHEIFFRSNGNSGISTIEIYTLSGALVEIENAGNLRFAQKSVAHLPNGSYIVIVKTGDDMSRLNLTVVH